MSYVYLIQNTVTGAVKIGSSKHPQKRLKQLQTGNSDKLKIIHLIKCERIPVIKVERQIQKWFRCQRLQGEWRKLSQEDLEFIKEFPYSV